VHRIIISIIYSILLALSACTVARNEEKIFEKVCSLPCWANIVPGDSTESDVKNIEADIPEIDNNQTAWRDNWETNEAVFLWGFIDSEVQRGEISVKNEKVESIYIVGGYKVSLEYMVTNYGDPDYVIIGNRITPGPLGAGFQNQVNLIYEEGLIIRLRPNKDAIINPLTKIDGAIFFYPESINEIINSSISGGLLGEIKKWEWQGYGKFTLDGVKK